MTIFDVIVAVVAVAIMIAILKISASIIAKFFEMVLYFTLICLGLYIVITVVNWLIGEVTVFAHF